MDEKIATVVTENNIYKHLPNSINILGQEYFIRVKKEKDEIRLKNNNGFIDFSTKEILLNDFDIDVERTINNPDYFRKRVLRHEIVHGFVQESGIRDLINFNNEEHIIDFFMMHFPKMLATFKELKIEE